MFFTGVNMERKNMITIMVLMTFAILPLGAIGGELTAGDVDDNLNFDHFQKYLNEEYQNDDRGILPYIDLSDRITIKVVDGFGRGIPNFHITISKKGTGDVIMNTWSGYDGTFRFFPTFDGCGDETKIEILVEDPNGEMLSVNRTVDLFNIGPERMIEIEMGDASFRTPSVLEVCFVIDTTGSMSDELSYITREFENIVSTIDSTYQVDKMRFALVVYRDLGDVYVVRDYDFTSSIGNMKEQLKAQSSGGGGDYPEAMDQGIEKANDLDWTEGNTARIMFLVADAPPHDGNIQRTIDAVKISREKGIHIYPLASSGVASVAEFVMRISAITTHGRYLFLTDDSGIGNSHAEPHISGYIVTTLKNLMVRIVDSEISGKRVEARPEQIIRSVGNILNGTVILDKEEQTPETNLTDDEEGMEDIEEMDEGTPEEVTADPVDETPPLPPAPVVDPTPDPISDVIEPSSEPDIDRGDTADGEIYAWDGVDDDCDPCSPCEADDGMSDKNVFIFLPLLFIIGTIATIIVIVALVVKAKKK